MMRTLLAVLVMLALPNLALAEDKKANTLFPGALDLPIIEGSSVPSDCLFPARLRNAEHTDLACVTVPATGASRGVGAEYLGFLGQHGWHQGPYLIGGFAAVKPAEHNCENYLGIYTSDYPPPAAHTTPATPPSNLVIWFALDREPHCPTPPSSAQ